MYVQGFKLVKTSVCKVCQGGNFVYNRGVRVEKAKCVYTVQGARVAKKVRVKCVRVEIMFTAGASGWKNQVCIGDVRGKKVCVSVRVEVICTAGVSGWKNQVYVQCVRVAKTRMYICNVSGWKLFVKGVSEEKKPGV